MSNSDDDDEQIKVDDPEDLPYSIDISGDERPVMSGDPPDWFTGADKQILFVMYTELVLTPSIIAENTEVSRQTVSKRLNTLQAGNFVEKLARGKYRITKKGSFAVSGDPDIHKSNNDNDTSNEID